MTSKLAPFAAETLSKWGKIMTFSEKEALKLQRPPFRLVYQMCSELSLKTGFLSMVLDELALSNPPTKVEKLKFITVLLAVADFALSDRIILDPANVIAGKKPEETNNFLVQLLNAVEICSEDELQSAQERACTADTKQLYVELVSEVRPKVVPPKPAPEVEAPPPRAEGWMQDVCSDLTKTRQERDELAVQLQEMKRKENSSASLVDRLKSEMAVLDKALGQLRVQKDAKLIALEELNKAYKELKAANLGIQREANEDKLKAEELSKQLKQFQLRQAGQELRTQLRSKITELTKQNEALSKKLLVLEAQAQESSEQQSSVRALERKLQEATAQLKTSGSELEQLQAECSTLRPVAESVSGLTKQVDTLEAERDTLKAALRSCQTELAAVTETLEIGAKNSGAEIEQLTLKLRGAENERNALKESVKSLQEADSRCQKMDAELVDMRRQRDVARRDRQSLTAQLEESGAVVERLTAKTSELATKLERAAETESDLKAALLTAEARGRDVELLRREIASLKEDMVTFTELEAKFAEMETSLERETSTATGLRSAHKRLSSEVESLKSRLAASVAECEALKKENLRCSEAADTCSQLQKTVEALTSDLSSSNSLVASLTEEKRRLTASNNDLQQENDRAVELLKAAKLSAVAEVERRRAAEGQCSRLEAVLKEGATRLKELQRDRDNFEKQLSIQMTANQHIAKDMNASRSAWASAVEEVREHKAASEGLRSANNLLTGQMAVLENKTRDLESARQALQLRVAELTEKLRRKPKRAAVKKKKALSQTEEEGARDTSPIITSTSVAPLRPAVVIPSKPQSPEEPLPRRKSFASLSSRGHSKTRPLSAALSRSRTESEIPAPQTARIIRDIEGEEGDLAVAVEPKRVNSAREMVRSSSGHVISPVLRTASSSSSLAAKKKTKPPGNGTRVRKAKGKPGRVPIGYKVIRLLGKGGFGQVWLADSPDGEKVAVKHIPTGTSHDSQLALRSALNEIAAAEILSNTYPPSPSNADELGMQRICHLLDTVRSPMSMHLIYEVGGRPLQTVLFDVRGEFVKNERLYRVHQQPLYRGFQKSILHLKRLIAELLLVVHSMSSRGLVHADLRTDNIVVDVNELDAAELCSHGFSSLRVIDFGNSYQFSAPCKCWSASPEILPPEVLRVMSSGGKLSKSDIERILVDESRPHSVDVWSVGCVLLEIASGFPLWFPYRGRVELPSGKMVTLAGGLFACPGRRSDKILVKQSRVLRSIESALAKYPGLDLHTSPSAMDFLSLLLSADPRKRPSPLQALRHTWMADVVALPQFAGLFDRPRTGKKPSRGPKVFDPLDALALLGAADGT